MAGFDTTATGVPRAVLEAHKITIRSRLPNLLIRNIFPSGRRGRRRIERITAANGEIVAAKTRPNRGPETTKIRPWRRDLWCRASMHYRRASHRATNSLEARGRGAVGSAQPCQGWGRGFESRRPLDGADASTPAVEWPSGEATACKAVHTGSIPVSTSKMGPARLAQRESASLTRKRSLVQSQYRAPRFTVRRQCSHAYGRPHEQIWALPTISDYLLGTRQRGKSCCCQAPIPALDGTKKTRCPTNQRHS